MGTTVRIVLGSRAARGWLVGWLVGGRESGRRREEREREERGERRRGGEERTLAPPPLRTPTLFPPTHAKPQTNHKAAGAGRKKGTPIGHAQRPGRTVPSRGEGNGLRRRVKEHWGNARFPPAHPFLSPPSLSLPPRALSPCLEEGLKGRAEGGGGKGEGCGWRKMPVVRGESAPNPPLCPSPPPRFPQTTGTHAEPGGSRGGEGGLCGFLGFVRHAHSQFENRWRRETSPALCASHALLYRT